MFHQSIIKNHVKRIVEQQTVTDETQLHDIMALETVVENMLMALRIKHNHLTPIHKLPPEVLSAIFGYTRDTTSDNTRTAFYISHVCVMWRSTAIYCPWLWSDIKVSSTSASAHKLCLQRSADAPLYLDVNNHDPGIWILSRVARFDDWDSGRYIKPEDNIIQLLKACRDRIVSICFEIDEGKANLLQLFDFDIPGLANLSFKRLLDQSSSFTIPRFFPDCLFNGNMPPLTTLTLKHAPFEECGIFNNLLDLTINQSGYGPDDAAEFSNLIERSPLLERLEIQHSYTWAENVTKIMVLPKLKSLKLLDTPSQLFLSHLDAPNIQELVIYSEPRSIKYEHYNTPVPYFPEGQSCLSTGISPCLTHIKFVVKPRPPSSSFIIRGEDESGSVAFDFNVGNVPDIVNTTWDYLSTISLTSLTELTFDWPESGVPLREGVHQFFANAPTIRVLHLLKENSDRFLRPLVEDDGLCPDLDRICVAIGMGGYATTFMLVKDILQARAVVGKIVHVESVAVDGEEDASGLWDTLCNENQIPQL